MKSYNIKFPLEDNTSTNTFFGMSVIVKDANASDLLLLLLTEKGQRYYEPDYGTNLNKFIFEPNDKITQDSVIEDIKKTVNKFIPSISVDSVDFKWKDQADVLIDQGQLELVVNFTYSEDFYKEQGQIVLNF